MNKLHSGRKIGKRYLFSSGRMVTDKSEEPLEYESGLEKDILSLLIFDNAVRSIKTQPFTIKWYDEKKLIKYTPDILVEFIHPEDEEKAIRTVVFEVKPSFKLKEDWRKLKPKFKKAIKYCKEKGMKFKLITENHISKIAIKNINFLIQYRRTDKELDKELFTAIKNNILTFIYNEPKSISDLLCSFRASDNNIVLWILWKMVLDGDVFTDINETFTNKTMISRSEHKTNEICSVLFKMTSFN